MAIPLSFLLLSSCSKPNPIGTEEAISITDNTLETRTGTICKPDFGGCTRTDYIENITLASGCTVKASWTKWECSGGVYTTDITYTWLTGCDAIRQYWASLYTSGNFILLRNVQNTFFKNLSFIIEGKVLATLDPQKYACDGGVTFSSQVIANTCLSVCYYLDEESGYYVAEEFQCGQGCCVRYTAFCFDESTHVLQTQAPQISASNLDCGPLISGCLTQAGGGSLGCNVSCSRLL